MAKKKMPEGTDNTLDQAYLKADEGVTIPRVSLRESGFIGLKSTNGYIIESPSRVFRYPEMLQVVAEMRNNPTIAACMTAYKVLMSRAEWYIESPVGSSEEEIERGKFVASCMDDMEHSWMSTVANWYDFMEYGSHVSEKVFRRRLYKNGSRYNDGLVGLRKIAPRARSSIQRWDFSTDGRELLGVEQTLRYVDKAYVFADQLDERGFIYIPREKFLLFTCDNSLQNPEGSSILAKVYLAFKQLSLLQDQELLSVAKNIQGILKITAPAKYFDPNASEADKAVLAGYQAIINNYNAGTQRGLLVPSLNDDNGKALFTYDLMESRGQQQDVGAIIKRLQGDILSGLSCDVIKMGTEGAGSFSLSDGSTNILSLAVSHRLNEISDVLNQDLVKDIYARNGWEMHNLPKFKYRDISPASMEETSKFIQRVASAGCLELDRGVLNQIREYGGFEPKPDSEPIDIQNLSTTISGKTSSAGEGMAPGVGGVNGGTSTSKVSSGDSSAANSDNQA